MTSPAIYATNLISSLGMSKGAVAKALGVNANTVSRWFNQAKLDRGHSAGLGFTPTQDIIRRLEAMLEEQDDGPSIARSVDRLAALAATAKALDVGTELSELRGVVATIRTLSRELDHMLIKVADAEDK